MTDKRAQSAPEAQGKHSSKFEGRESGHDDDANIKNYLNQSESVSMWIPTVLYSLIVYPPLLTIGPIILLITDLTLLFLDMHYGRFILGLSDHSCS